LDLRAIQIEEFYIGKRAKPMLHKILQTDN
jgi:hypothetical protein